MAWMTVDRYRIESPEDLEWIREAGGTTGRRSIPLDQLAELAVGCICYVLRSDDYAGTRLALSGEPGHVTIWPAVDRIAIAHNGMSTWGSVDDSSAAPEDMRVTDREDDLTTDGCGNVIE